MHRCFPLIPAFIAAAALTLGSTPVGAQQEHNHGAGAVCACCQDSGGAAANRAEAQDTAPSADVMEGDPVDHAAMGHAPAQSATAAAGGCGSMTHEAGDPSSFAMPGMAGCGAMKATANTAADSFAEDPSVTE